jgi:hypothetical protein
MSAATVGVWVGQAAGRSELRSLLVTVPKEIIFEALSPVKRAVHEGKIRKSRGALFVAIVKRACSDRGIPMGVSQPLYAGRS